MIDIKSVENKLYETYKLNLLSDAVRDNIHWAVDVTEPTKFVRLDYIKMEKVWSTTHSIDAVADIIYNEYVFTKEPKKETSKRTANKFERFYDQW
jgi:hypothetical protein